MKTLALTILTVVLMFGVAGCRHFEHGVKGSGVRKTEKRDLKPFKAIDTSGAFEVHVVCQKAVSLELEGDDNVLLLIKTEVRDGILSVSNDQRYNATRAVILRISVPELTRFSTRGAGEIDIADVSGDSLELESTGAASIKAAGKTKSLEVSSTGAGEIKAANLHAEKVSVRVTGAASVSVFAGEQLDVTVSGAGSVNYGGNPKVVNKNVSGLGSINKQESQ
jgi:Putative auto-transporter adhesin, head GIN domain